MKLSVSAYRAHASAHKKILSNSYHSQHNYGSTAAASASTPTTFFTMKTSQCNTNKDDSAIEDNISPTLTVGSPNELITTESSPPKEDNDSSNTLLSPENKSPCQRKRKMRKLNHRQPPVKTLGSPSSSTCSQANDTVRYDSIKRRTEAQKLNAIRNLRTTDSTERDRLNQEHQYQYHYCSETNNSVNNINSNSNNNSGTENPNCSSQRPSTSSCTKGVQSWRNLRAVMLYYCSLRRIKRNGAKYKIYFCV